MDRRVKPGDDGHSPRGGATIKPAGEMGFSMPASDTSDKLPQADPALRAIAMPADRNPQGDIFGCRLIAQMEFARGGGARCRVRGPAVAVGRPPLSLCRS